MKKVRFGIIGTNFISDMFVSAVRNTDSAEAYAVYSRTEEKGAEFAGKHGIPKHFTSLDEMLNSEIDALYVASPTFLHCEHTLAALNSGKHVLCEKMIAVSYAEFEKMRSCAEEKRLVLIEAMRPDFDDLLTRVAALLPSIGQIREISLEYRQYSSRYDKFKHGIIENAFNPELKNSALADIGIYPLHFAIGLFGEPISLGSKSEFLENGFEASGELMLSYPEFKVKISYSKTYEGENISYIYGSDGYIAFDKINAPTRLTLHIYGDEETVFTPRCENMALELQAFVKAVCGESDYTHLLDVSAGTMRTVDKIYKSSGIKI